MNEMNCLLKHCASLTLDCVFKKYWMQSLLNYVPQASFIDPKCFHFWTRASAPSNVESGEGGFYCQFGVPKDMICKSEFGSRAVCMNIYEIRNSLSLLCKLDDNKLVFSYRHHPIMRVKVFGLIRQVSDYEKYYKCFVQDDSHTINCLIWKNDFVSVKSGKLPPAWGDFVLFSAFIKQMESSRILDIYEISLFREKSQSLKEEVKYLELRNQHRKFLNSRRVKQTIVSYWPVCAASLVTDKPITGKINLNQPITDRNESSPLTITDGSKSNEPIIVQHESPPLSLDSCIEKKSVELMSFFAVLGKHLFSIEEIIETEFFSTFSAVRIVLPVAPDNQMSSPISNGIFILDCVLFHLQSENLIVKVEKVGSLPAVYVPSNDVIFVQSILSFVKETKPAPSLDILIQMLPGIDRSQVKVKLDSNHLRKVVNVMEERCLLIITNGVLRPI